MAGYDPAPGYTPEQWATMSPRERALAYKSTPEGTTIVQRQMSGLPIDDYESRLRKRAEELISGGGMPSLEDMRRQAIGRMPVEFSQMNQAAMSNFAANNLGGSGFQQRAVTGMKQEQAQKTTEARQDALSKWQEMKDEREREGYDILGGLSERLEEKKAKKADANRQLILENQAAYG